MVVYADMLEELYQEIILDHYRRPRNRWAKVAPPDFSAPREQSPLPGDEIDVTAKIVDGKVAEIKFDFGVGCSICLASASIHDPEIDRQDPVRNARLH